MQKMNRHRWIFCVAGAAVLIGAARPAPNVKQSKRPTISFELLFHDLRNQGQWLRLEERTWVWQPNIIGRDWRPYSRGTWVITDAGWYWLSEHPWGYVTSHYGFWEHDGKEGWVWLPAGAWAPANAIWIEDEEKLYWLPKPSPANAPTALAATKQALAMPWGSVKNALLPQPDVARRRGRAATVEGITVSHPAVKVSPVSSTRCLEAYRRAATPSTSAATGRTAGWTGPDPAVIERKTGRKVQRVRISETRRRREVLIVARDQTLLVAYRPDLRETAEEIQTLITRKAEQYKKLRERPKAKP